MIFVSSDKFHRRCAPLFIRTDQEFVWGHDLKADLRRINQHYESMPETEREKGLNVIAQYPPFDDGSLVTRLWDRFLPRWRTNLKEPIQMKEETHDRLVQHIKRFADAIPLRSEQVDFDLSDPDALVLKRRIYKRRGKWWQLPKDLKTEDDA